MKLDILKENSNSVVPHAGTWIEILPTLNKAVPRKSFPTRERGLKFLVGHIVAGWSIVVPHAGTWIEITGAVKVKENNVVVPHAGTWIEIRINKLEQQTALSFPTRERGLKFFMLIPLNSGFAVVPHAGTWIEMVLNKAMNVSRNVVPHAGTWIEIKS